MRDRADLHVQSDAGYQPDVRPTDTGVSSGLSRILLAPFHPLYSNTEATQSRLDAFADAAQVALWTLSRVADRDVHGMDMGALREEAQLTADAILAALVAQERR